MGALKALKPLGTIYPIMNIGNEDFLQVIPSELGNDLIEALQLLETLPYHDEKILTNTKSKNSNGEGWIQPRIQKVFKLLIRDDLAWIDSKPNQLDRYYIFKG